LTDLAAAPDLGRLVSAVDSAPALQQSTKLARSLHSGRIALALREAIISGALEPGSPLVESKLAEQLAVSRGPVRSALNVLEGEGLVETRPNGRTSVVGFGENDLRDLFDVRFALESQGIRWAIERGARLRRVHAAFDELRREGSSTPRLVALDIDFHRALVEVSGSRFLTQAWLALAPVIQAVITLGNRRLAQRDPQRNFERIVESHRTLVDALDAHDVPATLGMLADQFSLTRSMYGDADAG
jgi:DNA-binding GntR family transcriptional regulator